MREAMEEVVRVGAVGGAYQRGEEDFRASNKKSQKRKQTDKFTKTLVGILSDMGPGLASSSSAAARRNSSHSVEIQPRTQTAPSRW